MESLHAPVSNSSLKLNGPTGYAVCAGKSHWWRKQTARKVPEGHKGMFSQSQEELIELLVVAIIAVGAIGVLGVMALVLMGNHGSPSHKPILTRDKPELM